MKTTIKKLWNEYLEEKSRGYSEEQKKISHRLSELGESFTLMLDGNQIKKFEEYCDARNDLYSIEKYEAFEKGVLFAARFILDATY